MLDSQQETAVELASEIGMTMLPDFYLEKSEQRPANIAALNHFYNGLYYLRKVEFEGLGPGALNVHLAIGRFEESIAADANWAPPHFGMARAFGYWAITTHRGEEAYMSRFDAMRKHVERALEIDDRYVPALAVLGYNLIARDRDFQAAREVYERIVSLGSKESHLLHAMLLFHEQKFDEAAIEFRSHSENQIAEGKTSSAGIAGVAVAYVCAGRYRDVIDYVNEVSRPADASPMLKIAEARARLKLGERSKGLAIVEALAEQVGRDLEVASLLVLAGEHDRARQAMQEVEDPTARELTALFAAALELGEYELAMDYLEASIPTYDPMRRFVHCDGRTDALAGNPRFKRILGEIGIPE